MANIEYAVGDINSTAKGSGARANAGKVSMTLVPLHLLAGTARVLMGGLVKYAPWNWSKGMPWSTAADCLLRHFIKWWFLREDIDKESGEHHLDHIICNALFLRHYALTYTEGDDRPLDWTAFKDELDWFGILFDKEAYYARNPSLMPKEEGPSELPT